MATSQNGWPANDITLTDVQLIPGTQRKLRFRKGDVGFLLRRLFAWIDANVENIDEAIQDDWGYAERPIRGSTTTLSNHASGTAGDFNAEQHQLGVHGTWSAAQIAKIDKHLQEYRDPATGVNVIRWGEHYSNRVDPMHFEINVSPQHGGVGRVAAKLRGTPTGNTPAPEPAKDVTIHIWSIQNGCGQLTTKSPAMRTTDEAYGDCRAFIAWARAKGFIQPYQEQGWVDAVTRDHRYDYAAEILTVIVRMVQQKNGLAPDGVFGPKTGAVMAKSGYKII